MLAMLKNKTVWGLVVVLALSATALFQGGMGVEWVGYRFGEALAPKRAVNPQVAVIAMDAESTKQFGPLPWPRSVLARLVDILAADKTEVAVLDMDLSSPENAAALDYLTQLKTMSADASAVSPAVSAKLDEARAALDTDAALVSAIQRSGHVLLAARGLPLASSLTQAHTGSPLFALQVDAPGALPVDLHEPLPEFMHVASGVGFLAADSSASEELPLLVQYAGHTVATLALLTAAREQGAETNSIGVQALGGLTLGGNTIPTDRHLRVLLRDD